jgi:hypothetical protein
MSYPKIAPLQSTLGEPVQKTVVEHTAVMRRPQCLALGIPQEEADWPTRQYHSGWAFTLGSISTEPGLVTTTHFLAPMRYPVRAVEVALDVLPVYRAPYAESESFADSRDAGARGVLMYRAVIEQFSAGAWTQVASVDWAYERVIFTRINRDSQTSMLRQLAFLYDLGISTPSLAYQEGVWDRERDAVVETIAARASILLDAVDQSLPMRIVTEVGPWYDGVPQPAPDATYTSYNGWEDGRAGKPINNLLNVVVTGLSIWGRA